MYRVVVVEDDRIIRRAIANSDWSAVDAEVVGDAADGEQALEVVAQTNPHLIVTDINMPFMDGITFAKKVRELNPTVRIIFLSGYDDFEYVREAMLLKSDDYLLKPVQHEQLLEKAEKALTSWREDQERSERLAESKPLIQQRFLSQVLFHEQTQMEIDMQRELFRMNIFLTGPDFMVWNITAPEYSQKAPLYELLRQWAQNSDVEVLHYRANEVFLLLSVSEENKEAAHRWVEEIVHKLAEIIKTDVYTAASSMYREMQELEAAIVEARIKMEVKKIDGFEGKALEEMPSKLQFSSSQKDNLERSRTFLNLLDTRTFSLEEAKRLSFNLVTYLCTAINQIAKKESDQVNLFSISQEVMQAGRMEQILSTIRPLLERFEKELAKQNHLSQTESLVQKAILFMQENYQDADLSLVRLANEIHVSSPYLSNLFKTETGQNFTELLLELRMEKAKELLRTTGLRTYEIAEQVGYVNAHYFSSSFKKYTKKTPSEYRKNAIQ